MSTTAVNQLCRLIVIAVTALSLLGMGGNASGDLRRPAMVTSGEDEAGGTGAITEGVVGRVTDMDGQPIEGVLIQARSLGGSGPPVPEIAILTDTSGYYAWPLLPGAFQMTATADGYQPKTICVTVAEGNVTTADVVLQKEP